MRARQILVVDDEIRIRELLRDIVQDEGYQVKLAENAAEAREYRQQIRPDIVLLDILRLEEYLLTVRECQSRHQRRVFVLLS